MSNTKIIAEIGINHKGDLNKAKKIIDIASRSSAWGVKFQYREIKKFYSKSIEIGDEILKAELKKTHISFSKLLSLAKYAKQNNLKVGISFFKVEDLLKNKKLLNIFDFIKIPSPEFNNYNLIEAARKTKKSVFISTGGNNEKTILKNIRRLKKHDYVIFHCISNYPTITGFQQLNFIDRLKKIKGIKVGYSSHDSEWEINLFALSKNIDFIERHLTMSKSENGLDDSSSSEEKEFKKLCKFANKYNDIMGATKRELNQGEILNMQNLGTSYFAKKSISRGSIIKVSDIELKAPRIGITTDEFLKFKNKKILRDVKKGEPINTSLFKIFNKKINHDIIKVCDDFNISLPIRFHDAYKINLNFPIKNNELHLSYGDIISIKTNGLNNLKHVLKSKIVYSIHLPDYISNNNLIDPLSRNAQIRKESIDVINITKKLANFISDLTKRKVTVVGSFSIKSSFSKINSLDNIYDFLDVYSSDNLLIVPQWLPKIAWYFGGAELLSLFCDYEDVEYIEKNKLNLCLDISHLILSANYANQDWKLWYKKLIKSTSHIHLGDAKGLASEGISLGKGDLGNFLSILINKNVIVLETWQGHLNNGEKFYKDLTYIKKNYG